MSTPVTVTTAISLSDKQKATLTKELTAKLGKIELVEKIDTNVLGGIKLQVGSTEYDATLKAKLIQLRQELRQSLS